MGYTKDAIKGISWTGLLRIATKAIGLLEAVILARILTPAQFGAYGIALLALGLLEVLTETGVNVVLLQEDDVDSAVDSAWVISILRGLIIGILLFLGAPLIATFFHTPQATILLQLAGIVPILRGFINPSVIKFQKELHFKNYTLYQLAIIITDTVVSLTVTYLTKNPIGIMTGLLAGVVLELFMSHIIMRPTPRITFHKAYLTRIFHQGKWVTFAGIFDYLFQNADNIVVGRMLGAAPLGIYQLAYSIAVIPTTEIGKTFVHVTTPIFIRFADDTHRLRRAFLRSTGVVFALAFPIFLIFFFLPQVFLFIFGSKWAALIPILPPLAALGVLRAVLGTSSALFLSVKKQVYVTFVTLCAIVGLLGSIVPLINLWGLGGAPIAALFGAVVSIPLTLYYIYRLLR